MNGGVDTNLDVFPFKCLAHGSNLGHNKEFHDSY